MSDGVTKKFFSIVLFASYPNPRLLVVNTGSVTGSSGADDPPSLVQQRLSAEGGK